MKSENRAQPPGRSVPASLPSHSRCIVTRRQRQAAQQPPVPVLKDSGQRSMVTLWLPAPLSPLTSAQVHDRMSNQSIHVLTPLRTFLVPVGGSSSRHASSCLAKVPIRSVLDNRPTQRSPSPACASGFRFSTAMTTFLMKHDVLLGMVPPANDDYQRGLLD